MTVKIGINGFGRIGRLAFRRIFELQARGGQAGDIEVAAINDLTTPSMLAYLLKYDSTHGTFRHDDGTPVEVTSTEDSIVVDGKEYKVYAEKDANNIPWVKNDGVEFVLECTGFYTSAEKSQAHINAGAKKVLISAPATDETTPTVVFGVNHWILREVCRLDSRCKIALIVPHVPDDPVALMRHMGAIIYLCFIDNLSRPLIDQLHAAGYLVDGSVINSKERMKTALEIGCDMVESDTPDQAIAWYRELTEETERHA